MTIIKPECEHSVGTIVHYGGCPKQPLLKLLIECSDSAMPDLFFIAPALSRFFITAKTLLVGIYHLRHCPLGL